MCSGEAQRLFEQHTMPMELVSCQMQFIRWEAASTGVYRVPGGGDVVIYSVLHQLCIERGSGDCQELHQDMHEALRLHCKGAEVASRVLL